MTHKRNSARELTFTVLKETRRHSSVKLQKHTYFIPASKTTGTPTIVVSTTFVPVPNLAFGADSFWVAGYSSRLEEKPTAAGLGTSTFVVFLI